MPTTAFQYVIDNAETLSIDSSPTVAQTISRDYSVRSVLRNVAKKRFTVTLPNGTPYDLARSSIDAMTSAGRITPATITFSPGTYGTWFEPTTTTSFTVICTNLPTWTITARNQVSWDGPFIFIEYTGS